MTAGNVDDGKSTLLGRLLYETKNIFIDQSEYLKSKSNELKKDSIDYSLLLDGLIDEKDQGITIDIAFKYFNFDKRQIVLVDSPGHVEFTKNMANASTYANIAIILLDVQKGITEQTLTHLKILLKLSEVTEIIFCVNKMDKIDYDSKYFIDISKKVDALLSNERKVNSYIIPISALKGENITKNSKLMGFYRGNNLLDTLKNINVNQINDYSNSMRVQSIEKDNGERLYFVDIFEGKINLNQELINLRTNEKLYIEKIYKNFKSVNNNINGFAAIKVKNEISILKGDVLSDIKKNVKTNSVNSFIISTSKENLLTNKKYIFKFKHKEVVGYFRSQMGIKTLQINQIEEMIIEFEENNVFGTQDILPKLSRFIILDVNSKLTLGFGKVKEYNDKGFTLKKQIIEKYNTINKTNAIWFTGFSGSGKTTLANELGKYLNSKNFPFSILDGDEIRSTLNRDLGFSDSDRIENNRRVAYIAKIMCDSGVIPIVSLISPLNESRTQAKNIIGPDNFKLIYLSTPIETCIDRNVSGLYNNKDKKEKNITGIDSDFDIPNDSFLEIDTSKISIEKSLELIIDRLKI